MQLASLLYHSSNNTNKLFLLSKKGLKSKKLDMSYLITTIEELLTESFIYRQYLLKSSIK